jgi:xanthine dehydrogenase accessory factor
VRLDDIRAALAQEGRAVLVLVAEVRGSAPREPGAAMLVTGRGARGTVGGGAVEHRAIEIARAMLERKAEARSEIEFPLGPALDQCCGGRMRLAFALLTPADLPQPADSPPPAARDGDGDGDADPRPLPLQGAGSGRGFELWPSGPVFREPDPARQVIVYGAGHVGRALVHALSPLPFRLAWVDARAGACAGAPEGVEVHETPLPEAVAGAAAPDAMHLVLTHSHALDLEIVTAVMARGFGFCGLIGSASKRALFRRRLAERGVPGAAIDRLTCPIGLPGLRDKRPAIIAASAAAQLLQVDAGLAARRPATRAG